MEDVSIAVFGLRAHNVGQHDRPEIAEPDAAVDVFGAEFHDPSEQCTASGSGADLRPDLVGVECENEETGHGQVGAVLFEGGDTVQSR